MYRLVRLAICCAFVPHAPGWWSGPDKPVEPPSFWSEPRQYARWAYNQTIEGFQNRTSGHFFASADFLGSWAQTSWDGWLWTIFDAITSTTGWLIFGKAWSQVKSGFALVIRLGTLLAVCVVIHYIFALCWPIVSVLVGCVVTLVWMGRTVLKCCGRVLYCTQRLCGGVPEAAEAVFFGPGTGETPETAALRRLKKGSDGERWILVRRDGHTAVFRINDSTGIKSSGLYVYHDSDTVRGDGALVSCLQGHDRLHLCRNPSCNEEGQHFKEYAVVKQFDAEKFQLAAATQGAQEAGAYLVNWFGRGATKAAKRMKDYASESENEALQCCADRIWWEDDTGRKALAARLCTASECTDAQILAEDMPVGRTSCPLCPKHNVEYLKNRFQLKCVMDGCLHIGTVVEGGMRLCREHAEGQRASSPRRSSRSRSRTRIDQDQEIEKPEVAPKSSMRRRVRAQVPGDQTEMEDFLEDIRGPETEGHAPNCVRQRRKRAAEPSPGHTPRSGVQRSLAKLGLVNSPDRHIVQTTLEEFMEHFVEGKELGLDEEDVRTQLATRYGMSLKDFTQLLYGQATEEQRKGTKGLTKFLAKWRKQLAAETPQSSTASPWSLVGTPKADVSTPEKSQDEITDSRAPAAEALRPKQLVVLPPPGIFDAADRKAGTGGGPEPMAELAKAIQQQTSELATLVKAQHETTVVPGGSMKSLGKTSEELVFLLRACGQYTVEIGEGEYGANLAQALLSAQASASTKLRGAGFRQKVTPRLAIGLAGPFWGTQEAFALSAADFVACSDAELDNFAMESRIGKPIKDQRPAMPTRYEEWLNRVKRQNDIWALVYGKEWKPVRDHAADLLGMWHTQAPHKWPLQVIIDVWEELHWKFVEELKGELRKVKALAGRETMQLSDLKFYALMPDEQGNPPLQLPRTFDLNHPDGWFSTEVLPRIERRQERLLWKLTYGRARQSSEVPEQQPEEDLLSMAATVRSPSRVCWGRR